MVEIELWVPGVQRRELVDIAHVAEVEGSRGKRHRAYGTYTDPGTKKIHKANSFVSKDKYDKAVAELSAGMPVADITITQVEVFAEESPVEAGPSDLSGPTEPDNAGVPADVGGDDIVPYDSPSAPPADVFVSSAEEVELEAEAGDDCPNCHCSHENLSLDDSEPVYLDGEIAWVDIQCDDCGMSANAPTYEFEFQDDSSLKDVGLPLAVDMTNPNYGALRCTNCHTRFAKSAEQFTLPVGVIINDGSPSSPPQAIFVAEDTQEADDRLTRPAEFDRVYNAIDVIQSNNLTVTLQAVGNELHEDEYMTNDETEAFYYIMDQKNLDLMGMSLNAESKDVVIYTSPVPSDEISQNFGLVTSEVVLGANIFKDIGAGLRDIAGGRSGHYEKTIEKMHSKAQEELKSRAAKMGANAVVNLTTDMEAIGARNTMFAISMAGTAVELKKSLSAEEDSLYVVAENQAGGWEACQVTDGVLQTYSNQADAEREAQLTIDDLNSMYDWDSNQMELEEGQVNYDEDSWAGKSLVGDGVDFGDNVERIKFPSGRIIEIDDWPPQRSVNLSAEMSLKEWGETELNEKHHNFKQNPNESFKQWLNQEIAQHGNVSFREWADEEEHDEPTTVTKSSEEGGQACDICSMGDDLPYDADHFKECRRCGKTICHECWGTEIHDEPHYYEVCTECWDVLDNVARYSAESTKQAESHTAETQMGIALGIPPSVWLNMDIESQDGYISSLGFDVDEIRDMQAAGEFEIVMDMTNATKESETPGDLSLITCNVCGISQAQLINDEGGVCTITDPNAGANPNFKVGMDCPFQKYYSMVEAVSDEFIERLEEDKTIITIHEPQPEMAWAAENKTDALTKYAPALRGMKNNMLRAESNMGYAAETFESNDWQEMKDQADEGMLAVYFIPREPQTHSEMRSMVKEYFGIGGTFPSQGHFHFITADGYDIIPATENDEGIEEPVFHIRAQSDSAWDAETFKARTGYVFPERKAWPIGDKQHANIAMDYMEEGKGNPEEYDEIREAIEEKYGDLEQFESQSFSAEDCNSCGERMPAKWVEHVCSCGHTEMNRGGDCPQCDGGELVPKWVEYVCRCGATKGPLQISAENFEATRGIDTFTQPFEDDEKTNWLAVGGIVAIVALAGYMIPKGK